MDIFTNPWITGIGGGIISSLIVFFVTRFFFTKKENREYLQKIETANNEILYSIRPLIIDKKVPSKEILQSIKSSISKKYGVQLKDLYSEHSLINDLIYEIMGNSFLTPEQKTDFCTFVQNIFQEEIREQPEIIYLKSRDSISSKYTSILLATISFMMVTVATLIMAKGKDKIISETENFTMMLALATLVPVTAAMVSYLLIMMKRMRQRHEIDSLSEKKEETKDNVGD